MKVVWRIHQGSAKHISDKSNILIHKYKTEFSAEKSRKAQTFFLLQNYTLMFVRDYSYIVIDNTLFYITDSLLTSS